MVILQFNKLIRNKWVWGVFAVVVGGAFAFDFMIDDLIRDDKAEVRTTGVGTLGGESVAADLFRDVAEDARGIGKGRDWKKPASEVNRTAWETLAMLAVAEKNDLVATDAEVREAIRADRSFQQNGAFSFKLYQLLLRENGITPERFEAFLKRRLTQQRVALEIADAASWISPMELDRAVADMTDVFTVKIARFTEDKAAAAKVTLDAAALRKWYDDNTNSLALPERVKIRYVKFDANDPKLLAQMTVTEDEMRDQYDATIDKYTSKGTNGVEVVKKFDEVKAQIEKDLRLIAAVQCLETNLSFQAYAGTAKKGVSRLDEIAKANGLKVETSNWFALDGSCAEGFDARASSVCPGAEGFLDIVAQLDPTSEDLRYGVVLSKNAAWLIERADLSKAHVPSFKDAANIIRPRALKAAQEDAFKASVEAIARKGAAEVAKTKDVSTNLTFSVSGMTPNMFPNQYLAASAMRKLSKGEVSDFVRTGADTGLLVICENRVPGDVAEATAVRGQARQQLQMLVARELPEAWEKWNLARLGFEPTDDSSVTPEDVSADED